MSKELDATDCHAMYAEIRDIWAELTLEPEEYEEYKLTASMTPEEYRIYQDDIFDGV